MTPDDIMQLISQGIADGLVELEARVDRAVAARPLPPFMPPTVWTVGAWGAGNVVRHRNGIFMARRDTVSEPPDESWLPLLVGVAGLDLRWSGDREVALRAALSDGTAYEMVRSLAIPIVRGYWDADARYEPGDRVFRSGEWHALADSRGVDPQADEMGLFWLKVGGKHARPDRRTLAYSDQDELLESGHVVVDFKQTITRLVSEAFVPVLEQLGDRLATLERRLAEFEGVR